MCALYSSWTTTTSTTMMLSSIWSMLLVRLHIQVWQPLLEYSLNIGCLLIYLPVYSPDLTPIEESYSCCKCSTQLDSPQFTCISSESIPASSWCYVSQSTGSSWNTDWGNSLYYCREGKRVVQKCRLSSRIVENIIDFWLLQEKKRMRVVYKWSSNWEHITDLDQVSWAAASPPMSQRPCAISPRHSVCASRNPSHLNLVNPTPFHSSTASFSTLLLPGAYSRSIAITEVFKFDF